PWPITSQSYGPAKSNSSCSNDQHAIAVRIEPVALLDGVPVSGQREILPSECADQQEKTGPRQVEVSQHCAGELKLEARVDKQIRLASRTSVGKAFERPHTRGSDCHSPRRS